MIAFWPHTFIHEIFFYEKNTGVEMDKNIDGSIRILTPANTRIKGLVALFKFL